MNQFPYLYPHSLSEVERLNEEELWQDTILSLTSAKSDDISKAECHVSILVSTCFAAK